MAESFGDSKDNEGILGGAPVTAGYYRRKLAYWTVRLSFLRKVLLRTSHGCKIYLFEQPA